MFAKNQIKTINQMKSLSQSEIKSISFLESSIRVSLSESGELLFCAEDIFSTIFGNDKYSHLKIIAESNEAQASFELGKKLFDFYNIFIINERFLNYDIPEAVFKKKAEKYEKYINFILAGGCNSILEDAIKEFNLSQGFMPFINKDIDNLLKLEPEPEQISETPKLELASGKELVLMSEVERLQKNLEIAETKSQQLDKERAKLALLSSEIALRDKEIEKLSKESQEQKKAQESKNSNKLKEFIKSEKTRFGASVAAILIFLPFTVMALREYIAIEASSMFGNLLVYILCFFIASAWDFSILMFSENGKKNLSLMGSIFQFIFIAAKFNFFAHWIHDLTGSDGFYWQKMIVISAICIYSPVVVNQFTALADKK
jgi:hypothetical protein